MRRPGIARHTRRTATGRLAGCAVAAVVASVLAPVPGAAQDVVLEAVGEIPGPAELVRVRGDRAYVSGGHKFTVYDVSTPSSPVALGSHTFPQEIWGFRLTGDRAYVGANFFGLGILDISGPGAPILISQHKTLGQAKIGAPASGKVGIIDHMEGFVLVDVSDETAPAGVGSFFLDGYRARRRHRGHDGLRDRLAPPASTSSTSRNRECPSRWASSMRRTRRATSTSRRAAGDARR